MAKPDENPGKGNGPNKQDASLTLRLTADQNGDGLPNHGDTISFDVVADDWEQIAVECRQQGVVVFGATLRKGSVMTCTLASQNWQIGAADGVAMLHDFDGATSREIARLDFAVGA